MSPRSGDRAAQRAAPGHPSMGGVIDIPTPAAVSARGLTKVFGPVRAVDGMDLTVRVGEVVAFLGPSRPTSGQVQVFGMDPAEAIGRGLVAAVLQNGGLLKDLTVGETVRLTAALYAAARPVDEVLARAGIAAIADRLVGKCSGGQQQRLRFALALLPDPAVLLLDEPTA